MEMVRKNNEYQMEWGKYSLVFGPHPLVMGVVNVTPDSFSDGGKFFNPKDAIAQGIRLAEAGADILDIGGESTRPFSEGVSIEDEIKRVIPVIKALSEKVAIPISIDTTKADVAHLALETGASIINDISALRADENIAEVTAKHGVPIILMHMLGEPKNMQKSPAYDNVISDIKKFLEDAVGRATNKGISRSKIIIDPGIGFGKTIAHNLLILKRLESFMTLGLPVLIGPSRKSFIQKILRNSGMKNIQPDVPAVETGTQAVIAAAALQGIHMVRVHDVAGTVATLKIMDAIQNPPNSG